MGRQHANRFLVRVILLAVVSAGMAACETRFENQYAEAERWRSRAADAGYEWSETGSLLEQARQAEQAGDTQAALQLVATARFQAEAAVKQSEIEAGAWEDRVVR